MILSGPQIIQEVELGRIVIEPFEHASVNPNSYNYHLGDHLKVVSDTSIDSRDQQAWTNFELGASGALLEPGRLYLGHTHEVIGSREFVTSLIGRSSIGRLGLFLQLSADLSQMGAANHWTLEMTVVQPLRIYPRMVIGQVSFWLPQGEKKFYAGAYALDNIAVPNKVSL